MRYVQLTRCTYSLLIEANVGRALEVRAPFSLSLVAALQLSLSRFALSRFAVALSFSLRSLSLCLWL